MAEQSPAGRCRHHDHQPYRGGSAGKLPRRQFRSAGIALWYLAVRRSFAQGALSGVFDVVHATRRGEEGTERRSDSGWRQGGVIMAQQLQFTAFSRLLHWTMAIMVL